MDDVVFGEKFEGFGHIEDHLSELVLVVADAEVEVLVVNAIHLLVIVLFAFELVEGISEGVPAFLVENPGVLLVDEVVVEFDQVLYAWAAGEFLFRSTSELEEVCAEPNLLYVGLMAALGNNLLYCVLLLAFLVLPKPNQTKPTPPKQFNLIETIRETISKGIALFLAEIIRVLPFLFPF